MPGVMGRGIRHLLAGGVGTLAYMLLVSAQVELLRLHALLAVVSSFTVLLVYTYVVNRHWVYNPTQGHGYVLPRFLVVVAVALVLNFGIMYGAVEVFRASYMWGLAVGVLVGPPTNFLLNYYWAFR